QCDERMSKTVQVHQLRDLAALEPLVTLNLFAELVVERTQGIHGALHFTWTEAHASQTCFVLVQASAVFLEPPRRPLILAFVADHGWSSFLRFTSRLSSTT